MSANVDAKKKSEVMQLRTTKFLKEQVCSLSERDGISKNSVMNQAIAWYVDARTKNAVSQALGE
ncbi:hypothetical protein ACR71G_10365 [Xenorhabdus bovienii]|uniref:hypothetical protein n=1 Tax=Xenorhabdus bovienii TaxID=40576 RepID=UPI003DA53ACF